MSGFIRVRQAGGAGHLFDAPVELVEAYPSEYKIVGRKRVDSPRPPKYVSLAADAQAGSGSVGKFIEEKSDGI